jgi:hypothetical protein
MVTGSRTAGYGQSVRRFVVLVVIVAVAAAADLAATGFIERRVAEQVSASLGAPATVTLSGWPVAARLLAGRLPRADVAAEGVVRATLTDMAVDRRGLVDPDRTLLLSAGGGSAEVDLGDVQLRLPEVRGSLAGLTDPGQPVVLDTPGGRFEAELSDDDATALLGIPQLEVQFEDGYGRLSAGPVAVEATAAVEDGAIVLRPRQPLLEALLRDAGRVVLRPPLPPTAELDGIELRPGVVRLFGSVQRFELPPL